MPITTMYHLLNLIILATLSISVLGFSASPKTAAGKTSTSSTTTVVAVPPAAPALADFDYTTQDKLPWVEEGYQTWKWQGNDINYIEMGDPSKPALILIHGFGASAYHFRYNIPILARDYHVFAFDMLGFGLSSKPIQQYNANVWSRQTIDFVDQIVQKHQVTLAGNSLGGYTALATAANHEFKDKVKGCILLNSAGRFSDPDEEQQDTEEKPNAVVEGIKTFFQRSIIGLSFVYTKQPMRIGQVLRQVYPMNADNVDDELIQSIEFPSNDPNAPEVFYRVITKEGARQATVDELLQQVECPLLLCWGEYDPWIRPVAADKIQQCYTTNKCQRVSINAGHCPHDEAPQEVNAAIQDFMQEIHSA